MLKDVKLGDFICKKCQSSAKEYDKNNEKESNNNEFFCKKFV
jgi:hypothetical protein